jgi:hypothetical protein
VTRALLAGIIHREARKEREESAPTGSYFMFQWFAFAHGAVTGSTDCPSYFALFATFAVNNPN